MDLTYRILWLALCLIPLFGPSRSQIIAYCYTDTLCLGERFRNVTYTLTELPKCCSSQRFIKYQFPTIDGCFDCEESVLIMTPTTFPPATNKPVVTRKSNYYVFIALINVLVTLGIIFAILFISVIFYIRKILVKKRNIKIGAVTVDQKGKGVKASIQDIDLNGEQPSLQPAMDSSMLSPEQQIPTMQPYGQLSSMQTPVQLSMQPSMEPALQLSMEPYMQPALQLSMEPSMQPAPQQLYMEPSMQPSMQPALQLPMEPSMQPVLEPSMQPSMQPALQMSMEPSMEPALEMSMEQSTQPALVMSMEQPMQPSFMRTLSMQPPLQPIGDEAYQFVKKMSSTPLPSIGSESAVVPMAISSGRMTLPPMYNLSDAEKRISSLPDVDKKWLSPMSGMSSNEHLSSLPRLSEDLAKDQRKFSSLTLPSIQVPENLSSHTNVSPTPESPLSVASSIQAPQAEGMKSSYSRQTSQDSIPSSRKKSLFSISSPLDPKRISVQEQIGPVVSADDGTKDD